MERKTPFKVKLGEKIKFLRKKNNMTQGELGEKLGTIQPTVANWESGYSQPSNQIIYKLALLFNVSVEMVGWSPVTHNAKSEVIFDKPLNNEVDKPTSQGLLIINFTESS